VSAMSIRRRLATVVIAGAIAGMSALTGHAGIALARSSSIVSGSLSAIPVNGSFQIHQLFAGTDGKLWFVTPQSQLGEVSPTGQATLTSVTLPHGEFVAQIVAAGPEGVWSYGNTNVDPRTADSCVVGLVTPDGVLHNIALPAGPVRNASLCGGAVADRNGNLWLSLGSYACYADPCKVAVVAQITPAGTITMFAPYRPGARPGAMALGSDGAIWVFEGAREESLVRYTSAGISTSFPTRPALSSLYARPDGTFWAGFNVSFDLIDGATGSDEFRRAFPVSPSRALLPSLVTFGTAVDANGLLWKSGQMGRPGTGANRLFQLNVNATIDRTAAFPEAQDGSALLANGTVAVTSSGVIWAVALSGTDADYLIRFQPFV
jgi:streptogramin lyase